MQKQEPPSEVLIKTTVSESQMEAWEARMARKRAEEEAEERKQGQQGPHQGVPATRSLGLGRVGSH